MTLRVTVFFLRAALSRLDYPFGLGPDAGRFSATRDGREITSTFGRTGPKKAPDLRVVSAREASLLSRAPSSRPASRPGPCRPEEAFPLLSI